MAEKRSDSHAYDTNLGLLQRARHAYVVELIMSDQKSLTDKNNWKNGCIK